MRCSGRARRGDEVHSAGDRGGPWGLFDLSSDPGEKKDLSSALPEQLQEMDRTLTGIVGDAFERHPVRRRDREQKNSGKADTEIERMMRELGYMKK